MSRFLTLSMLTVACSFLLILLSGPDMSARADAASDCVDGMRDIRIPGCTKVIDSGSSTEPDLGWAYQNRGVARFESGQFEDAISDFDKALELKPDWAIAYRNRGTTKYAMATAFGVDERLLREAYEDYSRAIDLDPNDPISYHNRGLVLAIMRPPRAIHDLNKAIELDPNYALVYRHRGQVLEEIGRAEQAKADFEKYDQLVALQTLTGTRR